MVVSSTASAASPSTGVSSNNDSSSGDFFDGVESISSKCFTHASKRSAFVNLMSNSRPCDLANSTMSAFFILETVDFVGISLVKGDSFLDSFALTSILAFFLSDVPNSREKKLGLFFLLSSVILVSKSAIG